MALDCPLRRRPDRGHLQVVELCRLDPQLLQPLKQGVHTVHAGKNQPVEVADITQRRVEWFEAARRLDLNGRDLNHVSPQLLERSRESSGLLAGARRQNAPAFQRFFFGGTHRSLFMAGLEPRSPDRKRL